MLGAESWRRTWDVQQNAHEPEREQRFATMLDYVERLAGPPARLLDLACGTGSITERALARFPDAHVVAVDVDPVMLALAREALAGDERIEIVERDLREAGWARELEGSFDAVLTATALHWLEETALLRLYGDLATLLRPGGVFANADHMPIPDERLAGAADRAHEDHRRAAFAAGAESFDEWWARLRADPAFTELDAERARRFAGWAGELLRPAGWHADRLRGAGFAAAGEVWRWGNDAVLVAVR